MRLSAISESNPIRSRVLNIIKNNEGNPIFKIRDEFGCSHDQAYKIYQAYSGRKEGLLGRTSDVYTLRGPQCILKLLRYFKVNPRVASKLLKLYKSKNPNNNRSRTPDNTESLEQLRNGTRLVSLISLGPRRTSHGQETSESLEDEGFKVRLAPNATEEYMQSYVYRPEDEDVVDEIESSFVKNSSDDVYMSEEHTAEDLLNGLAFGYGLSSVLWYVRNGNTELIDEVCGAKG